MPKTRTQPTPPETEFRNAIVGYAMVAPDQLLAHPLNPKIHPAAQRDALVASIRRVGWLDPVTVNQRTGHTLDGHERIGEAIARNIPEIPVIYVDVAEEDETFVLATFDPIGALAVYDKDVLDQVLREVDSGEAAIQSMLDELAVHVGLPSTGGGTLALGLDEDTEGFAEGEQFGTGAEVVIKLAPEQANDQPLKDALRAFCDEHDLTYKIKATAK